MSRVFCNTFQDLLKRSTRAWTETCYILVTFILHSRISLTINTAYTTISTKFLKVITILLRWLFFPTSQSFCSSDCTLLLFCWKIFFASFFKNKLLVSDLHNLSSFNSTSFYYNIHFVTYTFHVGLFVDYIMIYR